MITSDEKEEPLRTETKPASPMKEGLGFVFETLDNRFEAALARNRAEFRMLPGRSRCRPRISTIAAKYGEVGHFIIPENLQVAGRYSEMTPNDKAIVAKASGIKQKQGQDELLAR